MHINIINRKLELKKEQQTDTRQRCQRLCQRFVDNIRSLTMRLSDLNGPRGGVDKECLVQIHLTDGGTITAVKRHEHILGAVQLCLDTARSRLRRKLGERKKR